MTPKDLIGKIAIHYSKSEKFVWVAISIREYDTIKYLPISTIAKKSAMSSISGYAYASIENSLNHYNKKKDMIIW